ncbi:TetR/AcrR family transcriptional regulator [Lolliginicoccus suaedae]|uniref:TetR/AcrR family transcriptional regulator n=1 Tax=Lolliginicoccus suaedae TaxID=2605429 RepID=UPI001659BFA3|nr:TetR/AcrR family transcriptional regulator [Lolliginicoccus suaedae]
MVVGGPRNRLITSAIELMCERGVHATGLAELLERSGTARRSIYQHFPGGKSELMEQATRAAGQHIVRQLEGFFARGTPESGVEALIDDWIASLRSTGYARGCPILAAAQAGPDEPAIQAAAAEAFTVWNNQFFEAFVASGTPREAAAVIADITVSTVEGAIVHSRALRSTTPLANARTMLVRLIAASRIDQPEAVAEVDRAM